MERAQLVAFDLPDYPGVYLFTQGKGRSKKVLYVGKATSLRDRVRSYFDDDLIATRGPRIVDMVTKAEGITHETTPTVLEALVREAALIRHYTPSANAEGKDDKTFLYAVITDEEIPRVLAVRGKDIDFEACVANGQKIQVAHGPFPSGYQLREALRLIRRIFPFYDTDKPIGFLGKHQQARVEFNQQIGQYPRNMDRKEYLRSIRNVSLFLSGRVKMLRATLTREMKQAAREERFEEASEIRGQLFALDHVQDVSLIKEERHKGVAAPRIEAYDTAHISGSNAIGVMTVVENGVPVKQDYRTFRIRGLMQKGTGISKKSSLTATSRESKRMNDDITSLKEILSRRLGHPEWPLPRAFVIDGGKTHKKAAESVLLEVGVSIPVVAVVKDEKHRPREVLGAIRASISEADAVLANSEAHRFSLAKHRAARNKGMRTGT
ncbi:UvrB/UvrC motif-containing protein [Patescibacteria group bacterium]|nr:UvrB/UvrC motif-containing protein [Patescibacteria group bacterium]